MTISAPISSSPDTPSPTHLHVSLSFLITCCFQLVLPLCAGVRDHPLELLVPPVKAPLLLQQTSAARIPQLDEGLPKFCDWLGLVLVTTVAVSAWSCYTQNLHFTLLSPPAHAVPSTSLVWYSLSVLSTLSLSLSTWTSCEVALAAAKCRKMLY